VFFVNDYCVKLYILLLVIPLLMRCFLKKGQVSIEYLAIFSITALMMIPLILLFVSQSNSIEADITYSQAENALARIVDSVEEIYFQGPPAQKTVRIHFPKGITNINISYVESNDVSLIIFEINTVDGDFEIFRSTPARINESSVLKNFEGEHVITFKSEELSVLITDK
jgi:uncharacterized protein (UPF0333 family)